MVDARAVLVALVVGVALGAYLAVWVRFPTFLSVGVGALVALITLLIAAALGDDPAEADRAWREAAPDLAPRRLGPGDGEDPE